MSHKERKTGNSLSFIHTPLSIALLNPSQLYSLTNQSLTLLLLEPSLPSAFAILGPFSAACSAEASAS